MISIKMVVCAQLEAFFLAGVCGIDSFAYGMIYVVINLVLFMYTCH